MGKTKLVTLIHTIQLESPKIFRGSVWIILITTFLQVSIPAHAHIYKWIDERGHTYYGDQYPEGTHPYMIIIPHYPAVNNHDTRRRQAIHDYLHRTDGKNELSNEQYYESIQIISPQDGQGVRANNGDFDVVVKTTPGLNASARHKLLLTIDGRAVSAPQLDTIFHMKNIDRGGHTLRLFVVADDSTIIYESRPVTVYVLRTSISKPWQIQKVPGGIKKPDVKQKPAQSNKSSQKQHNPKRAF